MAYFPFFREIEQKRCLVIGGGTVALRKVRKLLEYGVRVTVVAPALREEFSDMDVIKYQRKVQEEDLTEEFEFVIAATDSPAENETIYHWCVEKKIPVNVVDEPKLCTFFFPALIKKGNLSIGISTKGASPTGARWLGEELEKALPKNIEEVLDQLEMERESVQSRMTDAGERSRYFRERFFELLQEKEPPVQVDDTSKGFVSLVGAGCGTKEWITLAGLKELQRCDAVVYDDLIDQALLEEVPPEAQRIPVGKRSGKVSAKQEDIEEILVRLAREGKRVVRLKGGDPFVFGRGGEEAEILRLAGISWQVIPGISSPLAIPAEAGIAVTNRGISRSVHILTAHTREDALRRDLEQFAGLEGTLVILMGLERLSEIVTILSENGCLPETPVAVLSGGNTSHPYKVSGHLSNIVELAKKAAVQTPGIIVVGSTVAFDLREAEKACLRGYTVALTGTDDFQRKLRNRLLCFGADVVSLMEGECRDTGVKIPWEQITDETEKWLVFTSVQGVSAFFAQQKKAKVDYRSFAHCKFATIGEATREALEAKGIWADLCPREYTSVALAEELLQRRKLGERIYLFSSKQGTNLFAETLAKGQVEQERFDLYDTEFRVSKETEKTPQYILFGSAGGVNALWESGYRIEEGTIPICIGEICAESYRRIYQRNPLVATEAMVDAMIERLLENVAERNAR